MKLKKQNSKQTVSKTKHISFKQYNLFENTLISYGISTKMQEIYYLNTLFKALKHFLNTIT